MSEIRTQLTRLSSLFFCVLLACAGGDGSQGASRHGISDGPLTPAARRHATVLADSTGRAAFEAERALVRIGRDAIPALLDLLEQPRSEASQSNAAIILGGFGLGMRPVMPELQRLRVEGDARTANLVDMILGMIEKEENCGLADLPQDVELHFIGRYQGVQQLDVQLGDSGHLVRQIDVVVAKTKKPVVLVLTAYDPVVWRVGLTESASLAGVYVSGYHTQALLGIPESTPHRVLSGEQSSGCEAFRATNSGEGAEVSTKVLARTGHPVDHFHFESPTEYFVVGGTHDTKLEDAHYTEELSLDDYSVYRGEIPAGTRGLDELARLGRIRPATAADLQAFRDGGGELAASEENFLENVYVVLEPITLPPGLFGAHSRTFIVPLGVPAPEGPKGHCTFLMMDGFGRR